MLIEINKLEKKIQTQDLQLDIVKKENVLDVFHILNNYQVIRYTDIYQNTSIEYTENLIAVWQKELLENTRIFWLIKNKTKNKTIGIVGFSGINWKHSFASITCALNQQYWRKEIGSEALKAIINFGFHSLNLYRLEAQVFVENNSAVKLFDKLRFINEGILRGNFLIEGKFESSVMFSLLKPDFEKAGDFFKF